MRASGCHASSRIRFTVSSRCFSLDWLFGLWTVDIVSTILSFLSNCLYVVVLLHLVKAELTQEGLRHFCAAVEIVERNLDPFCDLHETRRVVSRGIPSCLLVTVWLERSIAFFSVFLFSKSVSNLAGKLESVNARKLMTKFETLKLLCSFLLRRQRSA